MASMDSCPAKRSKGKIEENRKSCNQYKLKKQEQELDPCRHAVEISIRNCTRPGCKHHTTNDRVCVWPDPCPADCFEQHPVMTRSPKHCVWPVN